MQTVTVQPATFSQSVTVTHAGPETWSSGICDCCEEMGICCFAFWCFPCFQCATVSDHGECLCLPLLDTGCGGFPATIPPISLAMRASVRERYKIHGSIFNDCCMMCWCLSCSWCQMAREIKQRKVQATIITAQTTTMMSPMPAGQPSMYPQYMQQR
ncbi:cornifelin homolog [Hyperolius riggenbachi]|uniref:cornifelin homolog n=1 Tax=Hyperolius riggenbachi TaxID=752182 RepID=UPI0035A301D3